MTRPKFFAILFRTMFPIGCCALFAGCQTTTVRSGAAPTMKVAVSSGASQQQPFNGDAIEAMDPCGDRMEDLCGPLALYFRDNGHGPARLEELQPYAFPGERLNFTCPVSGKPYLCSPQGLEAQGQNIRIYIYDATPVHTVVQRDGTVSPARWCAVARGSAVLNQPQVMYAVKLPEAVFRRFNALPLVLPIQ